jgi:hypothetical protein
MVRPKEAMAESHLPGSDVPASVIDDLLDHLRPAQLDSSVEHPISSVPQSPNVQAIADELGIEVRRGGATTPDFQGIVIPEFYSEREARQAIARGVARLAVDRVGSQCQIEDGEHTCPSTEICNFVETAKSDDRVIDTIAAAVLMPTHDFVRWCNLLGGQETALADSYRVPRELTQIRLRTIESELATDD